MGICTLILSGCTTEFGDPKIIPDAAQPVCGNGITEAGETCDGPDLAGATCESLGHAGGTLVCSAQCTYDTTECVGQQCGNGELDPGEECDDGSENSDFQPDACRTNCLAPFCGDAVTDSGEQCDDGNNLPWDGCLNCMLAETRINTFTDNAQGHPSVAASGEADTILVAWESRGIVDVTPEIMVQRFDFEGRPQEQNLRVNETTAYDQINPVVDVKSNGSFGVIWQSWGQDNLIPSWGVVGRFFSAGNIPLMPELIVNQTTLLNQTHPDGTFFSGGQGERSAVVWETNGLDGDDAGIALNLVDFTGLAWSFEQTANDATPYAQRHAAVAALPAGGFVVAWCSDNYSLSDDYHVWARRFDADGTPTEDGKTLTQSRIGPRCAVAVTGLVNSSYAVVWHGRFPSDQSQNIYMTVVVEEGNTVTIPVSDYVDGEQRAPAVAAGPADEIVVVWESDAQDGWDWGVFGRICDTSGECSGDDIGLSVYTDNNQRDPDVAALGEAGFVAVWASEQQQGATTDVFMQLFNWAGERFNPRAL
jgi:cysteine-rich repeat protein